MIEKWFVELQIAQLELGFWRDQFPSHGDPYISEFTVADGNGGTKDIPGICCREFQRIDEIRGVQDHAIKLFAWMKGWVITEGGWATAIQNSRTGAVYFLDEDGTYHGHHFIEATGIVAGRSRCSAVAVVIGSDGANRTIPPKPTVGQSFISSADDNTKAALRYIAETEHGDWRHLYLAFEAVGKRKGLEASGASDTDCTRLVQTFSIYRHHKPMPLDGPPMSFHQARSLIQKTLRKRRG